MCEDFFTVIKGTPAACPLIHAIGAEILDEIIGGWLRALADAWLLDGLLTAIAIDGKWLRGVADGQVKLFAAMLHEDKVMIAQHRIPDETTETTQVRELLEPVDLEGAVVTADAAHAQRETAEYIAGKKEDGNRGSDYFLFLKGNQPSLQKAVFGAIQEDGPREPDHTELDYSHGRVIRRSIWVTGPGPARSHAETESHREGRELAQGGRAAHSRTGSKGLACSGAAACRALWAGALRARRCRRSAASAPVGRQSRPQRTHDDHTRKSWPGRPPHAGHALTAQDHSKGRSLRSRLRRRSAPPLSVIFHGKTQRLSGGRGRNQGVASYSGHACGWPASIPFKSRGDCMVIGAGIIVLIVVVVLVLRVIGDK